MGAGFKTTPEYVREVMRCAAEGFVRNGKVYIPDVSVSIDVDVPNKKVAFLFMKNGKKLGSFEPMTLDTSGSTTLDLSGLGVAFMVETDKGLSKDLDMAGLVIWGCESGTKIIAHGDGHVSVVDGSVCLRLGENEFKRMIREVVLAEI